MRQFIDLAKTLFEGEVTDRRPIAAARVPARPPARPLRSGPAARFLDRVRREAGTFLGVPEDEISPADVRDWLGRHRALFHRKRVTVYRVMRLPETTITTLKPGDELGQHWSFNFNPDNIEGFNTRRDHDESESLFLLSCEIDAADIALELTVAYNCVFPHEEEVFVGGHGAAPVFRSVQRLDADGEPEDTNLRPDLVGQPMSA